MRQLEDWLISYLDYTKELESPELFHVWSGVSALATMLGRNVWLERGYGPVYPNHYIILVAKSALCRKSVAVLTAKKLIDETKQIAIMADRISNAGLLTRLHKVAQKTGRSEVLIFSEELAIFLSKEEAHRELISTLTGLYGCPDVFINELKTVPIDELRFVCLNILAATTPTDLRDLIPDTATGKGFTPRLHIPYQTQRRHKKLKPFLDPELKVKLVWDLLEIRKMQGEYKIPPEDDAWCNEWYESLPEPPDETLDGFYGRKHDTIFKLSMILAASESDELVLRKEHVEKAQKLINQLEQFMPKAYRELGKVQASTDADRVLIQMERRGGTMTKSEVLHDNWNKFSAKDWIEISYHMQEAGLIEVLPGTRPTTYRLIRKKK